MIFRQLFDHDSYTYTYLIADDESKEALLIDSVLAHADSYVTLLAQLGVRLKTTLETHTHADHITASGVLRSKTGCTTLVAQQSHAHCAAGHFKDGDTISVGQYQLKAIYTPGHTDDSFCFYLDSGHKRVFTGDTLLIRGCGRTDFQNGNAHDQYYSLQKLLRLPPETLVYPGHDYKGWSVSTIAEEKQHNPRLQTADEMAFVKLMQNLKLDNPKMMDVAVPANQACGNVKN
jgi:glyoxylase-like metal-dependent hydrolase (beta-lactamase superfamily II)